ncbi:hypothetical protein D3C72_1042060 [compost metagenome]
MRPGRELGAVGQRADGQLGGAAGLLEGAQKQVPLGFRHQAVEPERRVGLGRLALTGLRERALHPGHVAQVQPGQALEKRPEAEQKGVARHRREPAGLLEAGCRARPVAELELAQGQIQVREGLFLALADGLGDRPVGLEVPHGLARPAHGEERVAEEHVGVVAAELVGHRFAHGEGLGQLGEPLLGGVGPGRAQRAEKSQRLGRESRHLGLAPQRQGRFVMAEAALAIAQEVLNPPQRRERPQPLHGRPVGTEKRNRLFQGHARLDVAVEHLAGLAQRHQQPGPLGGHHDLIERRFVGRGGVGQRPGEPLDIRPADGEGAALGGVALGLRVFGDRVQPRREVGLGGLVGEHAGQRGAGGERVANGEVRILAALEEGGEPVQPLRLDDGAPHGLERAGQAGREGRAALGGHAPLDEARPPAVAEAVGLVATFEHPRLHQRAQPQRPVGPQPCAGGGERLGSKRPRVDGDGLGQVLLIGCQLRPLLREQGLNGGRHVG